MARQTKGLFGSAVAVCAQVALIVARAALLGDGANAGLNRPTKPDGQPQPFLIATEGEGAPAVPKTVDSWESHAHMS
jgi:hypothetical protein